MLETMLEALFAGLGLIFQWHVLAYFALGCVIGILMGASWIPSHEGPHCQQRSNTIC